MSHHFKVGDRVSLAFGFYDQSAVGTYAVTRLLPTRLNGEPQYGVKGSDDRERVIGVVAPKSPDISHGAAWAAMNSRGERYPSDLCG